MASNQWLEGCRSEGVKAALTAIVVFTIVSTLPRGALACTYVVPNYTVGNSFTVHVVSEKGLTFAGVRVILWSGNRVTKSALTNSEGVARFDKVNSDVYALEIDQLGEYGPDTATVTVKADAESRDIKLRWPSAHILEVTELKGILLDAGNAAPLTHTPLELVNAIDRSLVARDLTQETGDFDLGAPAPGFYFLKLASSRSANPEGLGAIPVLVVKGLPRELVLAVQGTSCGMQCSELCTARTQAVSHLAGTLADASGAAIARTRIELLRPGDKRTLATVAPDKSGHFDFQYMPDDEYQFRISAVGFAPLLVPITLASDSNTKNSVDLQLNIIGSLCNDATAALSVSDKSVK